MTRNERFALREAEDLFPAVSRVLKRNQSALDFHDAGKRDTTRWCSMQICGNGVKVRAYAASEQRYAYA